MFLQTSKTNRPLNYQEAQTYIHNKSLPHQEAKAGVPIYLQRSSSLKDHPSNAKQPGLKAALESSLQSGSALPDQTRQRFQSAFGADLSTVRIHQDPRHNLIAKSLKAKAFTFGSDIFFGPGFYRPGTQEGDRLLAHELTHVLQQQTGRVQGTQIEPGLFMGQSGDGHEQEADLVSTGLMFGKDPGWRHESNALTAPAPAVSNRAGALIQQNEEDEEQGSDYSLLPPAFSYRTGPFGISADTSAARLNLFSDQARSSLGYKYGGDIFYGLNLGNFKTRIGVNPQTGVGSLNLGGSHGGFRYGLQGSTAGSFGLSLGYGAPLLPMPSALGQQAGAAWEGATAVGGAFQDFASDPMASYEAYRDQIGAMGAFGRSLGRIYSQQGEDGLPFGFGLNVSYNPEQRWVLGAGIQGSF